MRRLQTWLGTSMSYIFNSLDCEKHAKIRENTRRWNPYSRIFYNVQEKSVQNSFNSSCYIPWKKCLRKYEASVSLAVNYNYFLKHLGEIFAKDKSLCFLCQEEELKWVFTTNPFTFFRIVRCHVVRGQCYLLRGRLVGLRKC